MSVDESVMAGIIAVAVAVKLELIMVGNAASALHGVPITTEDVDFFIRHTPLNLKKLKTFAEQLDGALTQPFEPASRMIRVVTPNVSVDFVFDLSSRKRFESVRSRAARMKIGRHEVLVASLEDVIAAKEAAGRKKDKATLQILKDTLRTKRAIERTTDENTR